MKKNYNSFTFYIHQLLNQVHPSSSISTNSISTIDSFIIDMIDRIVTEAKNVCIRSRKKTITARSIASAVRLVLRGEIAKHANTEGTKALNNFVANSNSVSRSKSVKAGLKFPVGRIRRLIKIKLENKSQLSNNAAVYLTAVLEYLTVEILELSGNVARDQKKTRINSHHINRSIKNDKELSTLMSNITIAKGGVINNIHEALLPPKKTKTE